jgi:hypothetical protein
MLPQANRAVHPKQTPGLINHRVTPVIQSYENLRAAQNRPQVPGSCTTLCRSHGDTRYAVSLRWKRDLRTSQRLSETGVSWEGWPDTPPCPSCGSDQETIRPNMDRFRTAPERESRLQPVPAAHWLKPGLLGHCMPCNRREPPFQTVSQTRS